MNYNITEAYINNKVHKGRASNVLNPLESLSPHKRGKIKTQINKKMCKWCKWNPCYDKCKLEEK